MGITDRVRQGGARRPTEAANPDVPPPRSSPDARAAGREPGPGSRLEGHFDFARLFSRLRHVAIWTGAEGTTFLLRTADGCWYAVERDSPDGVRLLLYLGQLPGLDTVSLRRITERPDQAPGTVTLWYQG